MKRTLILAGGAALLLAPHHAGAQSVANGGFESDTFSTAPGYVSDNAPITGWTALPDSGAGLNPAGGQSDFANNGSVPEGSRVAFVRGAGSGLATTVTGLTPGRRYRVQLRANATQAEGVTLSPILRATLDDSDALTVNIYPVGGTAPYATIAFEFEATATSHQLTLFNDAQDDGTLLVDAVSIAESTARWTIRPWTGDSDSGIDPQFVYTHAYNFGSAASATINGVIFSGANGSNPSVAGRFSTTFLGNVFNGDANAITGAGQTVARDFIYGGTVPAGSFQSIQLEGLTPGSDYVFSVYSVGWESPSPTIRWMTGTFEGGDALTFNQDLYDNDQGILISYRYTATAAGTAAFRFAPVNPANVSMHFYGFSNREAVSRNVAPELVTQPVDQVVAQGVTATFAAVATGFPTPAYRWQFEGNDLSGGTNSILTLPNVSPTDAGNYRVLVSNALGAVTSVVAHLTVGLPLDNASFEADAFPFWPGYSGDNPGGAGTDPGVNGAITGWLQSNEAGSGINPIANGAAPFANAGVVPNGQRVAFLQAEGTLSQSVRGLVSGSDYYVHFHENARAGGTPTLEVLWNDAILIPARTLASGDYQRVHSEVFKAAGSEAVLAFSKSNPLGGDTTALIDNVSVVPVPAGTAPWRVREPESILVTPGESVRLSAQVLGSLPLSFQWTRNGTPVAGAQSPTLNLAAAQSSDEGTYALVVTNAFGSVTTSAARLTVGLPGIYGTGIGASGELLEPGTIDPHYRLVVSPDVGTPGPDAIVLNEAWPIAPGVWMLNGPSSKWIGPQADQAVGNAEGEYVYETRFQLTGVDPARVRLVGGWATDNNGLDILVNGASTGFTASGFGSLSAFEIRSGLVLGENIVRFRMSNLPTTPNPTGLRVDLRGVVDVITAPPTLEITRASAGLSIRWSPSASGERLQSAADLSGPWSDVTGSANPFTAPLSDAQRFYRVAR